MPDTIKTKGRDERLQIRIDNESKSKIEQAASYCHKTISDFVVDVATEAANRIIEERTRITLSDRDWASFMEALENPPEPNEALKAAYKRYKQRHKK
jgi:uncharacterized protein (DUF1778 family)